MKRENRPARTGDRPNFGNGCMTQNVAALRSPAAASSSGRRCCSGLSRLGGGHLSRLGGRYLSRLGGGHMSRLGCGHLSRFGGGHLSRLGGGHLSRFGVRCAFGCAFRCFFPPLRASRAAGALFGTGRTAFLLASFRSESSMACVCCCTPLSSNVLNSSSCASAG